MKKILVICLLCITVISCGPRLIYPHLEWLIPWYVSDYVSLNSQQKSMLEKRLAMQLDWHCRTQLPMYAQTLRALGRDLNGLENSGDFQKIRHHYDQFMELWKNLMRQISPDIADILMTATNDQIDELFKNLAGQNQKFKEKYVDPTPEVLNKNRQNRMTKQLRYWISNLNDRQKQAVSDWSSRLEPISEDWLLNRRTIQAEAQRIIKQRNSDPEFQAALLDLLAHPERWRNANYQYKIDHNTEVTLKFLIQLNRMLTSQQRTFLNDRIESLATDFDKLSCDPKDRETG